jgi:glycine/D-amino acid oxidase-like deaminating enzyme/nitrite reductase/ring-hydroxylating ferredoxin subunit
MNNDNQHPENQTSGRHATVWTKSSPPIKYKKLTHDIKTDVVIIGGGIAGVTTAYCLSKSGKKVVLVEDGYLGSGETGRTTAHLVTALDDRYYELERIYGKEEAKIIAGSHRSAIDFAEKTAADENIMCQFRRVSGYLFLHPSDTKESLEKEFKAAGDAGIEVKHHPRIPGMKHIEGGCIEFKNQGQFHPLLYLRGLAEAATNYGAAFFTETHAKEINSKGIVTGDGFKVEASHVVVTTNTPVNNIVTMHLKQYPYRTYVIGAIVKKGDVAESLWWDTGDFQVNENIPPYHYIRTEPFNEMFDLLIVGGEDHPTGLAEAEAIPEENRYTILEEWAKHYFPIQEVIYRWSGQVMEPMDGLAFIGRNPMDKDNVYIATGDSGNGMTHGTIAGMLITDLINGKENEWERIYHPSRFKIFKSGRTFLSELVGGLRKYYETNPKHPDAVALSSIQRGEGKIVELDGKKYGCYCDESETLHFVEAKCAHLGCIVRWNNDEKSWDCPCHGSRFTYEGNLLNGPAIKGLEYHKEPAFVSHVK